MQYTTEAADLTVGSEVNPEDAEALKKIGLLIFTEWCSSAGTGTTRPSEKHRLRGHIEQYTEGQSSAQVYGVHFYSADTKAPVIGFVIKHHQGSNGERLASEEKALVRRIASSHAYAFSSNLITPDDLPPEFVVYIHARYHLRSDTQPLDTLLATLVADQSQHSAVEILPAELKQLLDTSHSIFDGLSSFPGLPKTSHYLNQILRRLPPSIILESVEPYRLDGRTVVLSHNGNAPFQTTSLPELTVAKLISESSTDSDSDWVYLTGTPLLPRRGAYLPFQCGDDIVWFPLNASGNASLEKLDTTSTYRIVFHRSIAISLSARLKRLGFQAPGSIEEFLALARSIPNVTYSFRHTDLHAGNILAGANNRLIIIDLSGIDQDLPAVSQARLEVSIWRAVTQACDIKPAEVRTVLARVLSPESFATNTLSSPGALLFRLTQTLRQPYPFRGLKARETALAYATQILLQYRYALEGAFDGPIPSAYLAYCDCIFRQCASTIHGEDLGATQFLPTSNIDEARTPVLFDLWRQAVSSLGDDLLDADTELLLDAIGNSTPSLKTARLRDFQLEVWSRLSTENIFSSRRNVLLSAPTSTGKTTIAQMLLVAPMFRNTKRVQSIYLAPTRALTQAVYRSLMDLFRGCPDLQDEIVISTGEDNKDEYRILQSRFSIACMVYEKANILFSQNRKMLNTLSTVVIDEIHMLTDIDRGPILEIALAKGRSERRRADIELGNMEADECLRLIGLTTEGDVGPGVVEFFTDDHVRLIGEKDRGPIIITSSTRPIPIVHSLLLPGKELDESVAVQIVAFSDSQGRKLPPEAIREISLAIRREKDKASSQTADKEKRGRQTTSDERLVAFVTEFLRCNATGRRLLVFIPGKADVERFALEVKARIEKTHGNARKLGSEIYMADLRGVVGAEDDGSNQEILLTCADLGIFVHHADIDSSVRYWVERHCDNLQPGDSSEVLFSTETLAYGVNLALSDVVLFGTVFNSRNRRREPTKEALSPCDFHNMAGRVGRLGKGSFFQANVYVLVARYEDGLRVVRNYYTKEIPVVSQLYVGVDQEKQIEIERGDSLRVVGKGECDKYTLMSAKHFSYPFARGVVDALRHLNLTTRRQGGTFDHDLASWDDVLTFFEDTLFHKQKQIYASRDPGYDQRFRCAVRQVLEISSRPELGLVILEDSRPALYEITPLGEAIIDTGTELTTVDPLLRLTSQLTRLWQQQRPESPMPIEVYLLCIVAQEEVYRDYLRCTPEYKGMPYLRKWSDDAVKANREFVLMQLDVAFGRVGVASPSGLSIAVRDLLDNWAHLREKRSGYAGGSTDAVLRLFCAVIAWIMFESRSQVERLIESVGSLDKRYEGNMQGLRQFTESLHYKVRFLTRLLSKESRQEYASEEERALLMLSARVRFGCLAEGVPLFWTQSSNLRRLEAVALLKEGWSPDVIVSSLEEPRIIPGASIAPAKLRRLREDIVDFANRAFRQLGDQMTFGEGTSEEINRVLRLVWDEMRDVIRSTSMSYRPSSAAATTTEAESTEARVRQCFQTPSTVGERAVVSATDTRLKAEAKYMVHLEAPIDDGLWIYADRKVHDSSGSDSDRVIFRREVVLRVRIWDVRADWSAGSRNQPQSLRELLERERSASSLAIVGVPWLPSKSLTPDSLREINRRASTGQHTALMTPAAFCCLLTLLLRGLGSAPSLLEATQKSETSGISVFGIKELYQAADESTWLSPSMRDMVMGHFEINPWQTKGVATVATA